MSARVWVSWSIGLGLSIRDKENGIEVVVHFPMLGKLEVIIDRS
jgi:hypothetical protein